MSVCDPNKSFSVRSMKLPLHRSGDHNGNAFPISSSSSSSSSSCLGESSPESLQSLSGGPLDYNLLEATFMTSVMKTEKTVDVVLSTWQPEGVGLDDEDEDVPVGNTKSSDNSVSVYLDANTWSDDVTLSLNTNSGCRGNSEDESSGRGCGSPTPDSDATEIPDDDGEEALFLSVSSEMCVTFRQVNPGGSAEGAELKKHEPTALRGAEYEGPQPGPEELQICSPVDAPPGSQEVLRSSSPSNSPVTSTPPPLPPPPPAEEPETHGTQTAAKTEPVCVKTFNLESKKVPKLDVKPMRNKTGSGTNRSPSKTPRQGGGTLKDDQDVPDGVEAKRPSEGTAPDEEEQRRKASMMRPSEQKPQSPVWSYLLQPSLLLPPHFFLSSLVLVLTRIGAQAMVSLRSSELRPFGWDPVTKHQLLLQRASSRIGPGARQQDRTSRFPPGPRTGPPEPEGGAAQSSAEETRTRRDQNQNQGVFKPRTNAERPSAGVQSPTASVPKASANQASAGRPAGSRLPVKASPVSPSTSSPGSNENDTASKAGPVAPTELKPDERPSRDSSTIRPRSCDPPATCSSDSRPAPRPPAVRSRAPSLQARTSAAGLKSPTISSHITSKAAVNQQSAKASSGAGPGLSKQTVPLQRQGSTRNSRLNSSVWAQQLCLSAWQTSVDKNKPREGPPRPSSTSRTSSQSTAGNQQNQQLQPAELGPEVLNTSSPATAAPTVPAPDAASTTSGPSGPAGSRFKARTGSRSSPRTGLRPQNASRPGAGRTASLEEPVPAKQNQNKEQVEKKNQALVQLRRLLVQGNQKVEALATVVQHLLTQREETLKQKKELKLELSTLRNQLVASSLCCERLQEEKEEVRSNLEEALRRLEEQHEEDLVQLENRLRSFYQTEWDKVHQVYQEEADRCRLLMEQQVEELRSQQEAEKNNQEELHSQRVEVLKQEYQNSVQELRRIQQAELEEQQRSLKEAKTSLQEQLSELSAENQDLRETLRAEEERRRQIQSDKNLKDSHTVYLEQELDSLKVVLDMKNQQLHQKDKKLLEMDRLVETNVRLEECLKKVQQENEDYRARMDKHAALSKQLSSEQAVLQQTLQKESKVNKRLSMENEELLWKLHNGDLLASPRRPSPTSPFGSPRNSASFPTAAPLSPR
ncbi:nascent polypeptide-associated complex subunit alpha, muscle-specific form [Nematolebias whitei]|uniref:nascent polypeptide-associated complex subunit alpha, muscle-specific form n=1 Tax=Nematolebias whitei TaxID=451745 RepID=UPI00189AB6FF|nr:nascent polypeptide-associated complex subunit alpha, muscle-specific form [Nematolebias whitei]